MPRERQRTERDESPAVQAAMEDLTMSSTNRMNGYRAYGRAADALDPVAWRPPPTRRFDSRPANDGGWTAGARETGSRAPRALDGVPMWLVIAGGGLIAAAMGAVMGGMLAI